MKKWISIALVFASLLLICGCASTTPKETTSDKITDSKILPLPEDEMEFSFLSGAGAWRTSLTLYADGSFSGIFLDSDMGINTEEYPNGTAHVCKFTGKFNNVQKIDDHSYSMTLTQLKTEQTPGEEWIEDGIRYIAADPYGLDEGKEFVFYLPDMPIDTLSEDFLMWWPYRFDQADAPKEVLSCYGIRNVATEQGFFCE